MSPSRSLSLTRSSPTSRKTVSPAAREASTASNGISSISPGISPAVTSVGAKRRRPGDEVRHRLAEAGVGRFHGDVRAHPLEHAEESGAGRVHSHAGDPELPASASTAAPTRNAADEGSPGTWMLERLEPAAGTELDPAVLLGDVEAEGPKHPLGVVPRPATGSSRSTGTSPTMPASRSALLICALETGIA